MNAPFTSDLVSRLRAEYVQQSARCGEEDSQERSLLAQEAADEIEGAHQDITSLMDSLNGEVNEAERLRRALQGICNRWRAPHPRLAHETDLEAAINERDDLYALASAALAGSVHETSGEHGHRCECCACIAAELQRMRDAENGKGDA